jgi:hypothetical protein
MSRRIAAIALLLPLLGSDPAHARCEGATMLGGLHDAYRAMLIEDGAERLLAARTLLVLAGQGGGAEFAAHLARAGVEADADRLGAVLEAARKLARDVLAGGLPPPGIGRHSSNTDWLGTLYFRTGCGGSALTPESRLAALDLPPPERRARASVTKSSRPLRVALLGVASALALAALAGAVWWIGKTLFWRRRQVERQPRSPVSFDLDVSFGTGVRPAGCAPAPSTPRSAV